MQHKPRSIVVDWLNTIWRTDMPPNAKYLACYLRKYMNYQQDIAWPSYATIIRDTRLGRATVAKYLEYLESEGWIKRDRGVGVSTTYIATFPKAVQEAANEATKMIESSSTGELVREPNGSGAELTSSGGELQVVREPNTSKQRSKQISNQFSKPTHQEVSDYITDRGGDRAEADRFIDYYESKGWLVGKTKMKDWRAAVRNWLRNGYSKPADQKMQIDPKVYDI